MSSKSTKKAVPRGKKRAASPTPIDAIDNAPAAAASSSATDADAAMDGTDASVDAEETTKATPARAKRTKKEASETPVAAAASSSTAEETPAKRVRPSRAAATPVTATPARRGRASAAAAPASSRSAAKSSSSSSSSSSSTPTPYSLATLHAENGAPGEVLSFGSGDCSQLGLGADEDLRELKDPTVIKTLTDAKVHAIAIAAGSLHNLVLDRHHAVWSWGCNDDAALGRSTDEWLPEPVVGPLGVGNKKKSGVEVIQIGCGASHSIALTVDGEVYCFGTFRDANGVIGFSDTQEQATVPTLMHFETSKYRTSSAKNKHKIVQIAAGEHHDLALTETGDVYQWGDIGIGRRFADRNKKNKLSPSLVLFRKHGDVAAPQRIVRVFAGGHSSFALDENGRVWFWGPNNYSMGGVKNPSPNDLMVLSPTPVPNLPPIAKVACATHHTLFLSTEGKIYACGRNGDGRLGLGDMEDRDTPTLIESLTPEELGHGDSVADINCGECHTFVVTTLGRVYSFGYGDLLQLGNGVEEDVDEPMLIQSATVDGEGKNAKDFGRQVLQAAGGAQHSMLLAVARTSKAPWSDDAAKEKKVKKAKAAPVKKITDLSQLLPSNGWECQTCLVQNSDDKTVCAACETPRDAAAATAASSSFFAAAPAGVSFGAPAGVSFGAAAASSEPAGGISFGNSAPTFAAAAPTFDPSSIAAPTFGSTAAPAAATGGFSFGGTGLAGISFGGAPAAVAGDVEMKQQ